MSLADSLVFAQDFRAGVGTTATSLAGDVGTFAGSAPPTWDVLGEGLTFPGGASTVSWISYGVLAALQDLWYSPAGADSVPFTVYVRARWAAGQGGLVEHSSAGTVGWAFGMGAGSGDAGLELHQERATTDKVDNVAATNTAAHWSNVAAVNHGYMTTPDATFYVDGVAFASSAAPVAGSGLVLTDAAEALIIGRKRSASNIAAGTFNGTIACVYVWRRALTADEIASLEADPFAPLTASVTPASTAEILTTTITIPAPTYAFVSFAMNLEAQTVEFVARDTAGLQVRGQWSRTDALTIMHLLNTGDLRANSLIKRMMNSLVALGLIPNGSIAGTPL